MSTAHDTSDMIPVTVSGIPAFAEVTHYRHDTGFDNLYKAVSDWDYYGCTELEFELYDRKGYRAKWLEAKLVEPDVRIAVEVSIIKFINANKEVL